VAYADTYTQSNYYLASVADKIMLNKEGMLSWGGLYSETMFYKNLLDKIGVKMQVIKVGTFKSAVEPFIATEMSEPNRMQVTKMITDIWTEIISQVADSRQISAAKLQNYADENMLYSPTQDYVTSGLIDTLVYEQEVNEVLKTLLNTKEVKTVSNKEMKVLPDLMLEARNPKIAILYAVGDITDDAGDGIVGKEMLKTIEKVKSDSTIKGVVLRVNSPGGSAFASEQIWYALTQLKKDKPLVVSMGDYAASGGYYIACMADAIVAQPTTLTGSIGIFGMVPDLSGMMEKIGLNYDGVGTNKRSNMETSMIMGMNAETHELIQAHVNRGYELFVKRCADGRDLTVQDIKNIAEGRVWTGIAAMQNGLVDTLGGIQDAINMAADMAELEKYRVVEFPKKKDALTILMEELSQSLNHASQNNLHYMWRRFNEIKHRPYSLEAIMPMEINIR
jgi:protease-4